VIAMTEHATGGAGASTAPPDPNLRRPLYARGFHLLTRVGHAFMGLIYVVAVVALVVTLASHRPGLPDLVWVLMLVLFPVVTVPYLRASALYGTPEGIEIVRFGKLRTVPWQNVGEAEFLGWSLTYPARVAELTIYGEDERPVRFFATERNLAELGAMRARHGRG
jgi:hypothetical protein